MSTKELKINGWFNSKGVNFPGLSSIWLSAAALATS